jgi:hypothetical protein
MLERFVMGTHRRSSRAGRAVSWAVLLAALAVSVAACGSDADETEAPEAEARPTTVAESGPGTGTEVPPDEPDGDGISSTLEDLAGETGSASVTIGDETFEFSLAGTATVEGTTYVGRCTTLFGMIAASGFATDGRDITVELDVPPVDWATYDDGRFEPPAIRVEDNEGNANWIADEADDFVSGSGVFEFEQEGVDASGVARFVDAWDPGSDPIAGTFTVDCAG